MTRDTALRQAVKWLESKATAAKDENQQSAFRQAVRHLETDNMHPAIVWLDVAQKEIERHTDPRRRSKAQHKELANINALLKALRDIQAEGD